MALPISVTYTFATATSAIPLSQLDANFTTCVNGINGIGNGTNALSNVSITGGNATVTTVNATTLNAATHRSDTTLTFQSNVSTTAMTIDTSQRVGIGTTSPTTKFHVTGGRSSFVASSDAFAISVGYASVGAYFLGANSLNNALLFSEASGVERMRLDASGNLGIGTSAPTVALQVASTTYPKIKFGDSNIAYYWALDREASLGDFQISNANGGAATVQMTIATSGNVGIGTTSPTTKFVVNGGAAIQGAGFPSAGAGIELSYNSGTGLASFQTYDRTGSAWKDLEVNALTQRFGTSGSERMRIDTSGNLLINQTTADGRLAITTNGSSQTCVYVKDSSGGSNAQNMFYFVRNTTNVGTIQTTNTATSYNTSSDYRLKHSAAPMTTGLATISALKPVTYKWNVDNSDGEGFIAHELQTVIPHAVTGVKDAVDEDGKPVHQGVDYSKVVVHLVAAIQELKAEIDALKGAK